MVPLDPDFNATQICAADRRPSIEALNARGSKARSERGALSAIIQELRAPVWPQDA
jgi:hypothetical protein